MALGAIGTEYKTKDQQKEDVLIGMSSFKVSPLHIHVTRRQLVKQMPVLRQAVPTKIPTGRLDTVITMGIRTSLEDLPSLAQLARMYRLTPFVPIDSATLSFSHQVDAVALQGISVSTVPGFPYELDVTLTMLDFDHHIFLPSSEDFLSEFNPEVLNWYLNLYGGERYPMLDKLREDRVPWESPNDTQDGVLSSDFHLFGADSDKLDTNKSRERVLSMFHILYQALTKWQNNPAGGVWKVIKKHLDSLQREYAKQEGLSPTVKKRLNALFISLISTYSKTGKQVAPIEELILLGKGDEGIAKFIDYISSIESTVMVSRLLHGDVLAGGGAPGSITWLREFLTRGIQDLHGLEYLAVNDIIDDAVPVFPTRDVESSVTVSQISYQYSNTFAPITLESHHKQAYQYMGGGASSANVVFRMRNDGSSSQLTEVVENTASEQKDYGQYVVCGFLQVKNGLLNTLGMKYVLPLRVDSDTVPKFPGEIIVVLGIAEFDRGQAIKETLEPIRSLYNLAEPYLDIGQTGSTDRWQQKCKDIVNRLTALKKMPRQERGSQTALLREDIMEMSEQFSNLLDSMKNFTNYTVGRGIAERLSSDRGGINIYSDSDIDRAILFFQESADAWGELGGIAADKKRFFDSKVLSDSDLWVQSGAYSDDNDWWTNPLRRSLGPVEAFLRTADSIQSNNKGLKELKEGLAETEAYPDLVLPRYSEVIYFLFVQNADKMQKAVMDHMTSGAATPKGNGPIEKRANRAINRLYFGNEDTGFDHNELLLDVLSPREAIMRIDDGIHRFREDGTAKVPFVKGLMSLLNDNGGRYVDPDFYMVSTTDYIKMVERILSSEGSSIWLADRFGDNVWIGNLRGVAMPESSLSDINHMMIECEGKVRACDIKILEKSPAETVKIWWKQGGEFVGDVAQFLFEPISTGAKAFEWTDDPELRKLLQTREDVQAWQDKIREKAKSGGAALKIQAFLDEIEYEEVSAIQLRRVELIRQLQKMKIEVDLAVERNIVTRKAKQTEAYNRVKETAIDNIVNSFTQGAGTPSVSDYRDLRIDSFLNPEAEGDKFSIETVENAGKASRFIGKRIDKKYSGAPTVGKGQNFAALLTDTVYYSQKDRMIRAFPTMKLLFIDEPKRIFGMRLWTDLFAYNAITSCVVHRHRESAVDTCMMELSNVYGNLSSESGFNERVATLLNRTDPARGGLTSSQGVNTSEMGNLELLTEAIKQGIETGKTLWGRWIGNVDRSARHLIFNNLNQEEMAQVIAARILSRYAGLQLRPGVRIQIRMGYSGNVAALRNRFVGTVTEVNPGDQISILAEGDGREMLNKLPGDRYDEPSRLDWGVEAREWLIGMMAAKGDLGKSPSAWGEHMNIWTGGLRGNDSNPLGIHHFGNVYYKDMAWYDIGQIANPQEELDRVGVTELEMNVYGPNADGYIPARDWLSWLGNLTLMGNKDANVNFQSGMHTFWSISQVFADTAPGFIRAIEPFELRSTFFFGRPYWNYVTEYLYPESERRLGRLYPPGAVQTVGRISDFHSLQTQAASRRFEDLVTEGNMGAISGLVLSIWNKPLGYVLAIGGAAKTLVGGIGRAKMESPVHYDASGNVQFTEKNLGFLKKYYNIAPDPLSSSEDFSPWQRLGIVYKPFQQFHVLTTFTDIIKNDIKASKENIYNIVEARTPQTNANPEKGWEQKTAYVDTDIIPEEQKKIVINSGMVAKWMFDIPLLRLVTGSVFGSGGDTAAVARAKLRDFMKHMYEGSIILIGNPALKPHDLFYIGDDKRDMFGVAGVRSFTDMLTMNQGYITAIEPDATVCAADEAGQVAVWAWCASFGKHEFTERYSEFKKAKFLTRQRMAFNVSIATALTSPDPEIQSYIVAASSGLIAQLPVVRSLLSVDKWADYIARASQKIQERNPGLSQRLHYTTRRKILGKQRTVGFAGETRKKLLGEAGRGLAALKHLKLRTDIIGNEKLKALRLREIKEMENFFKTYESSLDDFFREVEAGNWKTVRDAEKGLKAKFSSKGTFTSTDDIAGRYISLLRRMEELDVELRAVEEAYIKTESERIVNNRMLRKGTSSPKQIRKFRNQVIKELKASGVKIRRTHRTADIMKNLSKSKTYTDAVFAEKKLLVAARERGAFGFSRTLKDQLGKTIQMGKLFSTSPKLFSYMAQVYETTGQSTASVVEFFKKNKVAKKILKFTGKGKALAGKIPGLAGMLKASGVYIIVGSLVELGNRTAMLRQAVTINTLTVRGKEYSAGINGHRGAVVGDDVGMIDTAIERFWSPFSETFPTYDAVDAIPDTEAIDEQVSAEEKKRAEEAAAAAGGVSKSLPPYVPNRESDAGGNFLV